MELEHNVRFRSDFYHDLKLQKECNRGSLDGNLFFRGMYLMLTATLIWFFWQMVIALDAPEEYAKTLPGIVAIWLMVEGIRLFSLRGGGIHYKRSLMLNGGKPTHDSVLFLDDCILTLEQESGNKAALQYDTVRVVYETENLLLLGMKYSVFLIVDKRTLTGTREEFGQFLYEKCPKLRHKKVRNCKTGRLINAIKWAVILLSILTALFFHPWLQINSRIQGQIHNGMSAHEIITELSSFGITVPESLSEADVDSEFWIFDMTKLESLLFQAGLGVHDYEAGSWTPAETGVFFTYYWGTYPETMYTDLLRGIDALSHGALVIENIREDQSGADWANYDGSIAVDFTLNGTPQHLDAVFYQEWYDEQTFNTLNDMILEATGKQLFFADYQDVGCFVFYGDTDWANAFAKRTGFEISSDINDIY